MSLFNYSCSSDDDTSTPPSLIQSPEPETPDPTQYILTISAGEGGSIYSEGETYDDGTEVKITATPNKGNEFLGW